MSLIEKLKLLFKIRKPAGELLDQVKEVKRGWKTLSFWVTLLGSLASTASALSGIIPPQAQLIATTVLSAFYNMLRGLQKAEESTVRGVARSTEVWMGIFAEVQKGIVALNTGGINPEWMTTMSTINMMAMAAGQQLASLQPKPVTPVENTPTPPPTTDAQ